MKNLYLLLLVLVITVSAINAQCTITPQGAGPGIVPPANELPCIVTNVPYDETLQITAIKDTTIAIFILSGSGTLDSIRVDSIVGLPTGITWQRSPEVLYGGEDGCLRFSGTTTDPVDDYPLTWLGTAWIHFTAPIDTHFVYNGNLSRFQFGGYFLSVINPGDDCHPIVSGIKEFSSALNASLNVYPNPSNGAFQVTLNAGQRVNGEINVLDMTGKKVYTEAIDALGKYYTNINLNNLPKGLYTVQVRGEKGTASKNISIE